MRGEAAVLDQRGLQVAGGVLEVLAAGVAVGLVQVLVATPGRVGHPQHAAEQLLHRGAGAEVADAAQDVGERAVPPLAELLHRDDVLDRVVFVVDRQVGELVDRAGADRHLLLRHPQLLDQQLLDAVDVEVLLPGLSLVQDDRADVAVRLPLRAGQLVEFVTLLHGRVDGVAAELLGPKQDRQLDHVRRLQAGGRHLVQHVAVRGGRGGQLQHARGGKAAEGLEGEVGAGVVGLVDDHRRPVHPQHVGEARLRRVLALGRQLGQGLPLLGGESLEVVLQLPVGLVDLAALGVLRAEGLDRGDDHHALRLQRRAAEVQGGLDVADGEAALEGPLQLQPVRVPAVPQGVDRLLHDLGAGGEPEDRARFPLAHDLEHGPHRPGGDGGLPAAGGHLEADVGHPRQIRRLAVRTAGRVLLERHFRADFAAPLEVGPERVDRLLLVVLEERHGQEAFTS